MSVIFNPGSKTYTPQTINQPLVIGAGVASITLTATRTDPSWANAVGVIASFVLVDPAGNPVAAADLYGGVALNGTQSSLRASSPNGAASFTLGTYTAHIVIQQTVTSTVQVVTA